MTFKNSILLLVMCSCISHSLSAIFPLNVFRPWDINLRPPYCPGKQWQLAGNMQTGLKAHGYNPDGDKVNVLQLWQPNQDALAMFLGFPTNSPLTQFFQNTLGSPIDDGTRGHLQFAGTFHLQAGAGISAYHYFAHHLLISAHLPIYAMKLSNIHFKDLTQNVTASDTLVRTQLTQKFLQVLHQFDPTLNLSGWERAGFGDLLCTAAWAQSFPQENRNLTNVDLTLRAGLSIPTGVRSNENQILSIPFGFDGSWGLLGGAGILVTWFNHLQAGIDFEFLHLFGNTRLRRIKTATDQTDFLFLAKVPVHTDYGFTEQYNIFTQLYNIYKGLTVGITYQFWKHGEDKIALFTDDFSTAMANSAQKLQEWTMHQAIFKLKYDFCCHIKPGTIAPHLMLFYVQPFNGKRAVLTSSVGAVVTLNF